MALASSKTRPEGAPLTGLPWRATQSEADEAPVSLQTCPVPLGPERSRRYAAVSAPVVLANQLADQVSLLCVLARRAPAGPPRAEVGADAGPRRRAAAPP